MVGSYKDRLSLPEDVARAKGHIELAEYLQDVNKRFSDENDDDGESKSIDWQELIQEVNRMQRQSSESEDKKDLKSMPSPEDGDSSDYFADAETSSCGSFEGDPKWADSEAPCTKEHAYLYGCPRTYSAFVKRCHANLAEEDYVPASVIAIQNDQAVAAACTKNKEPSGNEYKFGIPLVEGFHVNLAEDDFVLSRPARGQDSRHAHRPKSSWDPPVLLVEPIIVVIVLAVYVCWKTQSEIFILVWIPTNLTVWEYEYVETFGKCIQPQMPALKLIDLDDVMCYPLDLISTSFFELNDVNIICFLGCVLFFVGVVLGLFWRGLFAHLCTPDAVGQPILLERYSIVEDELIRRLSCEPLLNRHWEKLASMLDVPDKEIRELSAGCESDRDKTIATLKKCKQQSGTKATLERLWEALGNRPGSPPSGCSEFPLVFHETQIAIDEVPYAASLDEVEVKNMHFLDPGDEL